MIGYTYFPTHYAEGVRCQSLLDCALTNYDYTFKNNGGIGAWLNDPSDPPVGVVNYGRLIFDNVNNLILVFCIFNMIAGIIIDTFGDLREKLKEKEEDMEQFCFICGIDREKLDKSGEGQQGYLTHIKKDHNMWDYIYFKAYLQFKESTEYNGNESYIYDCMERFDLSWFPQNRSLSILDFDNDDDDDEENTEQEELIEQISSKMNELRNLMSSNANKVNRVLENIHE